MRNAKGFSLIELMIVVAIILIVVAIAIPYLQRSRMAANEASAVASLRTIATANQSYSSLYSVGFAGDLNHLGPPALGGLPDMTHSDLVDAVIAGCVAACTSNASVKSGYNFTYVPLVAAPTTATPNNTFTVVGTPVGMNTGTASFCVDQTGVILRDTSGGVTTASGNGCVVDGWAGATVNPI